MKSKYAFIGKRLREIGKTQKELADSMGITAEQLNITINNPKRRELQQSEIYKVANFLGYDLENFLKYLSGETDEIPNIISEKVRDSSIKIPYMNVDASAGDGIYTDTEYIRSYLALSDGKYAGQVPNIKSCNIITVSGDSMTPTFKDGEFVIVNTADTDIVDDRVYVLVINGKRFIKRLYVNPVTKKITIKSDNPRHPTYEVDEVDIHICGRVIIRTLVLVE